MDEYMENFTPKMARESVAMGFLTAGCSVDVLRKVCEVLVIDTTGIENDRSKLREAVVNNYAEGWE